MKEEEACVEAYTTSSLTRWSPLGSALWEGSKYLKRIDFEMDANLNSTPARSTSGVGASVSMMSSKIWKRP